MFVVFKKADRHQVRRLGGWFRFVMSKFDKRSDCLSYDHAFADHSDELSILAPKWSITLAVIAHRRSPVFIQWKHKKTPRKMQNIEENLKSNPLNLMDPLVLR